MLKRIWTSTTIRSNSEANQMVQLFLEQQPEIGATDTETDGLHIVLNKPFVVQFGWLDPSCNKGYTFAVDLEKQPCLATMVLHRWWALAPLLKKHLGHNIKFDLHMLTNIGLPPYEKENYSDTQFYIRYAHDALHVEEGGPPLKLKDYTFRYIDHKAKRHEQSLKQERTAIAAEYNLKLKQRLRLCGAPPEKYQAKSYTLKVIQTMFKDATFQISDLPDNAKQAYLDWLQLDLPLYLQKKVQSLVEPDMIPYNKLDRELLLKYAHLDIVYTLETFLITDPVIDLRQNREGIDLEDSLIIPLYEMERVGFAADKEYLEQCRDDVKQYIRERRNILYALAGEEFTISQHEKIKAILQNKYGLDVLSTGKEEMDLLHSRLKAIDKDNEAILFIEVVQELRTLEKWYAAYIIRFLKELTDHDRLYTTINQVGTISGRVTSDFQQFPKKPITTVDGRELFYPRKMIRPTGGDYNALVYLDYSQIELRFQAMYTVLVGHPDLNLCRAYMPFQCHHRDLGSFDCHNSEHIQAWQEPWYLDEDPGTAWEPTDVHAATTMAATGLDPDHPEFSSLRSTIGKRVNFAKNYGAEENRIRTMFPDKTPEEIKRINEAYYIAFPGVKEYHKYCTDRAYADSNTQNLFGIRYYNVSGHKLKNLLIQGSAAFFLKKKIRELYDYCKKYNIKSRWQMNIHDELSWERYRNETEVFFEFKRIMEDWLDGLVPIVADMEVTTETWAKKKGVETLNELQIYLSH